MSIQRACGLVLALLSLIEIVFAQNIFNYCVQHKFMTFEKWPPWMFPAWVWMMRIGGIVVLIGSVMLYLKNK
jgi:ABC-type multidrug transport system permease subunit